MYRNTSCFLACLLTVMISMTSASVVAQQDHDFLSQDSIAVVLDSCWTYYGDHEYAAMADYLEAHLPQISPADDSLEMEMHYALVMAYGHLDIYDRQFESITRGLLLATEIDNDWMLMALYRELGSFHDEPLGDQETGLRYMKKAIPYMNDVRVDSKIGLLMDIGLSSVNAGELDSAKHYYDLAFAHLHEDTSMVYDLYSFYAPYLIKTEQYDTALAHLEVRYNRWQKQGFREGLAESCIEYAEVYYAKQNYQSALRYASEAIDLGTEISHDGYISDGLEWKAKAQEKLGMTTESLSSFQQLTAIKKRMDETRKEQNLDKKRIEFVRSEFDKEMNTLLNEHQQLKETSKLTKKIMWGMLGILLLSMVGFYRYTQRKNERITELSTSLSLTQEQQQQLQVDYQRAIQEIEKNKRELTSTALFLEKKDQALKSVREMLSTIRVSGNEKVSNKIKNAKKLAEHSLNNESNWESFRYFFEQIYPSFYDNIKSHHPSLTHNELRCLSYIKIGLTDKESARLLGINTSSFQKTKYRIKKKLELPRESSVEDFLAQV